MRAHEGKVQGQVLAPSRFRVGAGSPLPGGETEGLGLLGNKTWDEVKFRRAKPG